MIHVDEKQIRRKDVHNELIDGPIKPPDLMQTQTAPPVSGKMSPKIPFSTPKALPPRDRTEDMLKNVLELPLFQSHPDAETHDLFLS